MRSFFSNSTTPCPARASCWAAASPAGPEPTTATRLPVFASAGSGFTQPSSQPLSMIACSIDLIPTGSLLMRRVHASSQGAGQTRPVNSGKIVGRMQRFERPQPVGLEYKVVEIRDDVVDRAAGHAERNAAVHAARALHLGLFFREVQDELVIVLLARLGRLGRFVQPRWYSRKPVILPI